MQPNQSLTSPESKSSFHLASSSITLVKLLRHHHRRAGSELHNEAAGTCQSQQPGYKRQANAVSLLFRSIEAHCMRVYSFVSIRYLQTPETQTLRSLVFFVRGIAIATALALPLFDKVIASGSASQQFLPPSQQDRNLRRTTYTSKTTAVRSRQTHHTHFIPAARYSKTKYNTRWA
jgi:hypothetical protein